jgi:predicted glycosyltransferase
MLPQNHRLEEVSLSSDRLRIALDITHPAHFHVFKYAIAEWQRQGHDLLILSRDKDVTLQLLDEAGLPHRRLSKARRGKAGLVLELIEHGWGVWRALGEHRSQVVAAVGGAFNVHASKLRGIPSLVFYDTENATISNRIAYPNATRIYTPRAYRDDLGPRHVRYNGYHELAYLHPNWFTPDPAKLADEGLQSGEPFTFIRLVSWQSHHDAGDYGVRDLRNVVRRLERYGRVLISSEKPLPDDLKRYARRGRVSDVHHVLAFARLVFGESATMASESAMLGVPAIFLSTSSRGYTDEQERRYQMVFNFNGEQAIEEDALRCAESILSNPDSPRLFRERHQTMMAELIDVTAFIMETVERYARGEAR